MELKGKRFILRAWQLHDVESLQKHANNINIAHFLFDSFPYPYTTVEAEKWVLSHQNKNPILNFAIIVSEFAVGGIGLELGKDIYRKSALLGYWIGEEFWGQGLATAAVKQITDYAFDNFDIIRIQAAVHEKNIASKRVLEKAGFKEEGTLKNAIIKNEEVSDEHIYAKLAYMNHLKTEFGN